MGVKGKKQSIDQKGIQNDDKVFTCIKLSI